MPRIQVPWYKWRPSWRHMPWFVVATGGASGSLYLINSGSRDGGILLLLVSLPILWGSSKTLWRNRQPFVFAVRGGRAVKFGGGGRDEILFEENGRKVKIYTELLGGKTSRAIHADSIKKYEAPHESEPLTVERQEEILDLLCEEYDYRGVSYEVVMSSELSIQMACPRCQKEQEMEIELPFGCIGERHYRIGDKVQWREGRSPRLGGRPENGMLRKEVWNRCPSCGRDFWLMIAVAADRIDKVEVDASRAVMIPDDSIPIVEGGKIVGHRVEPKKR